MRSTLFYIPHQIGPLPVVGWGWTLLLTVLIGGIWIAIQCRQAGSWTPLIQSLPLGLVSCALIVFAFPLLETRIPDGSETGLPVGLPIRGYGIMLMLGALGGVGLTIYRSQRLGITADAILSLAFWSFLGGIGGARLFYVVQKWNEFQGETLFEKLPGIVKFTEGGLVVYGGVLGGLATILFWCLRHRKSPLAMADLVIPGFMLGLCLGRIGCLLNGCCYGGICESGWPAITFPVGSPPYGDQLDSGKLFGLTLERDSNNQDSFRIVSVDSGTWAEKQGLKPGQRFKADFHLFPPGPGSDPAGPPVLDANIQIDGRELIGPLTPVPKRSRAVHPAQIYSSINALFLCVILYLLWPFPSRDGVVFATGLILYGFCRIVEEIIRVDEGGQFGTSMTISQWISLAGIGLGMVILASGRMRPASRAFRYSKG